MHQANSAPAEFAGRSSGLSSEHGDKVAALKATPQDPSPHFSGTTAATFGTAPADLPPGAQTSARVADAADVNLVVPESEDLESGSTGTESAGEVSEGAEEPSNCGSDHE